jgi:cytidylate kinase
LKLHTSKINIAIDGPAGAGKSTVARLVAGRLGYVYIDTGAMYRAVTWKAIEQGLELDHSEAITQMLEHTEIELHPGSNGQQVLVDQVDVSQAIRKPIVSQHVSQVAQIARVRENLSAKQKEMAEQKGIVMDGRDIGSHVLPNAELKLYLTASVEERAQRRYKELQETHPEITLQSLTQDIEKRDQMDQEREVSPLIQAKDAILIDSSSMTIEAVVDHIVDLCLQKINGGQ